MPIQKLIDEMLKENLIKIILSVSFLLGSCSRILLEVCVYRKVIIEVDL